MFKLFSKKKDRNDDLLKLFDGRCVKYVTRRDVSNDGTVTHNIIGKSGRITVIGNDIRVICGEIDVFKCTVASAKYSMLLSGDGVVIEGENTVTGNYDIITAYYSYYRK